MRFVFKTSYDADISLFKHRAQAVWYGLLLLLTCSAKSQVF
jgi:branched-chain amino acid transport system permease protein